MGTPFPPKLKLHHRTPSWVPAGVMFHVRIRCERDGATRVPRTPLLPPQPLVLDSDAAVAPRALALLDSASLYHARHRWHAALFLLMPDHLHALLAFPAAESMSSVVGDWKRFHAKMHGVAWQEGYFDHRIRNEKELELKADYVRRNPVVKGLCTRAEDWPWLWEPDESRET